MRLLLLFYFEGYNFLMSWLCFNFIFDNCFLNCLILVIYVFCLFSCLCWVYIVLDILLFFIKNLGYLIFWSLRSIISFFFFVYINENKMFVFVCYFLSCFERLIFCLIVFLSCLLSFFWFFLDCINFEVSFFVLE